MTEHLGEKYEGVRVGPLVDTEATGRVRPTGLGVLKARWEELGHVDGNEKVGLTDEGYAVYRNRANGRLGYYYMVVDIDGTRPGRRWYRDDRTREPHGGFGSRWIIRP